MLFLLFAGALGVLLLIDLFTIPRQIRRSYEKRELEAIERLKASDT